MNRMNSGPDRGTERIREIKINIGIHSECSLEIRVKRVMYRGMINWQQTSLIRVDIGR